MSRVLGRRLGAITGKLQIEQSLFGLLGPAFAGLVHSALRGDVKVITAMRIR